MATDYFISPDGDGGGLSVGDPASVTFIYHLNSDTGPAPGDTFSFADGTYTETIDPWQYGDSNNIASEWSGTQAQPIILFASTEGQVTLDGGGSSPPLRIRGSQWVECIGFNCKNGPGTGGVVAVSDNVSPCQNITFKRIVAWDNAAAGNSPIWSLSVMSGPALLEDCAGFGIGRKVFEGSINTFGVTQRRCFGRWEGSTNTAPKTVFEMGYQNENCTWENCIAIFDETSSISSDVSETDGLMITGNPDTRTHNNKLYGCIALVASNHDISNLSGALFKFIDANGWLYENCVAYTEQNHQCWNLGPNTTGDATDLTMKDCSTQGQGTANSIDADWTVTDHDNHDTSGTIDSVWTNATGALVCKRYEDGVLTANPLWPWPMDDRIASAITEAGKRTVTHGLPTDDGFVTSLIEQTIGTIASACRTDDGAPAASGSIILSNVSPMALRDADTTLTLTGSTFGSSKGSGKVELVDAGGSTYGAGTTFTICPVLTWGDQTITCTAAAGGLGLGTGYAYVTNDSGSVSSGFEVSIQEAMWAGAVGGI